MTLSLLTTEGDSLCGSGRTAFPCGHVDADDTADFGDRRNDNLAQPFHNHDHAILMGQPLSMDGDWYRGGDEVVRGVSLCPPTPFVPLLSPSYDFEGYTLTDSKSPSVISELDACQPYDREAVDCGYFGPSFVQKDPERDFELEEVRFDERYAAPLELTEPLFCVQTAAIVRLLGVTPTEAANHVLDTLRSREGVAILKLRPHKFSLKASAYWSVGLICELKVHVYAAVPTSGEESQNHDECVTQTHGAVVVFQRRSGDTIAFWKLVEAMNVDLTSFCVKRFYPRIRTGITGDARIQSETQVLPLVPQTIGTTVFGESLNEPTHTRADAASAADAVADAAACFDRNVDIVGAVRVTTMEQFAPLLDSMSRRHVDDSQAQAELASALHAAAECDPHSTARLCIASTSTLAGLTELFAADDFCVVYPAARALAAIAQSAKAADLFVGGVGGRLFLRLASFVLEKLEKPAAADGVKQQLALSLCRLSRLDGTWLVNSWVPQELVVSLQHLLLAPALAAKAHVQTRSWLQETLATLTAGASGCGGFP